jgi:hypothetical protein
MISAVATIEAISKGQMGQPAAWKIASKTYSCERNPKRAM